MRQKNPYPLYAASNLGSLLGLVAYPLVIEPFAGLRVQGLVWALAFAGFVALLAVAFRFSWVRRAPTVPTVDANARPEAISVMRRARWVALAFVPSSVMLGMTANVSTAIAPMPLLWTFPLALYLLTFVIAFSERTRGVRYAMLKAAPFAVLAATLLLAWHDTLPVVPFVLLHLAVVFLLSLACHGAVADDKPAPAKLTEFYLWLAVGGALGGVFNAIVAPLVFPTVAEYPIAIVLACALGAFFETRQARASRLDVAVPGIVCAALLGTLATFGPQAAAPSTRIAFALTAVVCFTFSRRRLRFALGIAAMLFAGIFVVAGEGRTLVTERNFFGVKIISNDAALPLRLFIHNATIHGVQSTLPGRAREPLSYYARSGPPGFAFDAVRAGAHGEPLRVAIAGLGIGSVACYARRGDRWTYFEIDPAVVEMARDRFTYLSQCTPDAPVVLGDARLSLERSRARYDLILLDAYTSDSPPLHLLSREAFAVYLDRLAPRGLLLFNISNRYFDLEPVLAAEARACGLAAYRSHFEPTRDEAKRGIFASDYVVVARDANELAAFARSPRWRPARERRSVPLWTDDYSSLLRLRMPG